jgi:hypothetical protein
LPKNERKHIWQSFLQMDDLSFTIAY